MYNMCMHMCMHHAAKTHESAVCEKYKVTRVATPLLRLCKIVVPRLALLRSKLW